MVVLTFDFSAFERAAAGIESAARQVPFVCAYALTNAMKDAREAEPEQMRQSFDRPTPYTLNAVQVRQATKSNLRAELGFKEFGGTPAFKYLGPEVHGGAHKHKGFERALIRAGVMSSSEFAVPAGIAPKNGYGNVAGSFITQMLSALGASTDRMQNTSRRPKRSNRQRNLDYFVLRGKGALNGIYRRQGRAAVPVFLFVSGATYKKRFPYYEAANCVIPTAFRKHFLAGWERFVVNDTRTRAVAGR